VSFCVFLVCYRGSQLHWLQVDFILLAGDLFHDNRPSRDCIYRVTALLREYTLGDKPVSIELLSDPDDGKASGFSCDQRISRAFHLR
jgi:hypothetical protein